MTCFDKCQHISTTFHRFCHTFWGVFGSCWAREEPWEGLLLSFGARSRKSNKNNVPQSRPVRFATSAGDPPGSILESKNGANHGKYKPEVSLGNFLRVPGKCFCQDYFFNGFLWFFQHVKTEKVCKTIGGSFKFEGFVFLSKKCIDIDFRLRLSFMGLHFGVILTLRRLLGAMFGQEKRNY